MSKNNFLKILGILFILFSALISIALLIQIPRIILEMDITTSYGLGYFVGSVLIFLLFATIAFFLFKYGLKWLSTKKDKVDSDGINSIGKIEK